MNMNSWVPNQKREQEEKSKMPKPFQTSSSQFPEHTKSSSIDPNIIDVSMAPDKDVVTVNNPLAKFDIQRVSLDKIKTYQGLVVDVEKPDTVKKAKKAKKITRDLRLQVQRREKEIDAGLVKERKTLKIDAGAIISEIKETENHLLAEIQKDTDHKAKLAEKARIEEAARVEKINTNMRILENHCEAGLIDGLTADQIQEQLINLNTTEIPQEIFQEKYQAACDLLSYAIESVTTKLAVRKNFEKEQAVQAAKRIELEKQQKINAQVSWFNQVFGFTGTVEGMEDGLAILEGMDPADYLLEIIEQQKIQGQDIIVRARAAKAEQDRLDQEKADRQYLVDWDEAIAFNDSIPVECELPPHLNELSESPTVVQEKTLVSKPKPRSKQTIRTDRMVIAKKESISGQRSYIELSIAAVKEKSENLQSLISTNPYELTLYLSDKSGKPMVIMTGDDGLSSILNAVKTKLNDRLLCLKK
ncbi:MAG: hypothetical protein GY710_14040 [Desulfobacteraceae bacterium]|nr:hypothetical protein [Desulfobacteraceae bacterium]